MLFFHKLKAQMGGDSFLLFYSYTESAVLVLFWESSNPLEWIFHRYRGLLSLEGSREMHFPELRVYPGCGMTG